VRVNGGRRTHVALALLVSIAVSACGQDGASLERAGGPASSTTLASTVPAAPTPLVTEPPTTLAPTTLPPPTTVAPPTTIAVPRVLIDTGFAPFATVEQVVLHHPAAQVEVIGFHEAGHDGARQMVPTAGAARPVELESRQRGTGSRTAADIVVSPDAEIRAPVTGTVTRAGSYVLYCEHRDDYAVIDPDGRPGWEVKILHIDGVQLEAGQRVEAGVTVVAPRPTLLPFGSQVDEHTAAPAWPHVHVEVVDPTIPDRPSPGGGSDC
jgi:murein DD-endopeptidase MepM/ murein hydrolase activator NlpD